MLDAMRTTAQKLELLEQQEQLEAECRFLETEVRRLGIIAHNEQADVENLKSPGIRGLLLGIAGKKQETLEKEQTEARHARQNFEAAAARQEAVSARLSRCAEELAALGSCEETLRQFLSFPEDSALLTLTRCDDDFSRIRQRIRDLMGALTKVSQLGAIRNGTQSPVALASTDDQLRAAERSAQQMLTQLQSDLARFGAELVPFGLKLESDDLLKIKDNYLTDLYTYALITSRVENITVALRQIGFQLDAIKPKLAQLTLEQQKTYLRTLLDAARSK